MSTPLNTIFQMSAPFQRKEGRLLNISCQNGDANSREAVFRVNTVCEHTVFFLN